jgi:Ni2+-binding GTPase involved in maturation of urease and hydrogenase
MPAVDKSGGALYENATTSCGRARAGGQGKDFARVADDAAPMSAAPFVWRPDGRPDWRVMWESFCDLALHGGPPHRGPDDALRAPLSSDPPPPDAIAEIRRGIWETTGLYAEPTASGWIAVSCHSAEMAAWIAAAVVVENVEARADDDRVLLPLGAGYRLENEVKSLVTVVAKTHHYWDAHLAVEPPALPVTARSTLGVPRPLKIGVGGPAGSGKTALIDAIRHRLDGRVTVAAPRDGAPPALDSALDLLLLERTTDDAAAFGRATVDATVGVLDVAAAARTGGHGTDGVGDWQLLVVSKVDTAAQAGVDLDDLQRRLRTRRPGQPLVLTDLTGAEAADAVIRWLEQELLLGL